MKTRFLTGRALRFTTALLLYGSLTMEVAAAVEKPRLTYAQFVASHHVQQPQSVEPTIASFIQRRIDDSEQPGARPLGISGRYVLAALQKRTIAQVAAKALSPNDLIAFGRERKAEGVKPGTVKQEISYLRGTLREFVDLGELHRDALDAFAKARRKMEKEQLIGNSVPRDRLPEVDELLLLFAHFEKSNERGWGDVDMVVAYEFLLAAGRRISEMCRIERQHVNVAERTCKLYDLKDARGKGKHGEFALLGRAWQIVEERLALIGPEPTARLFPWRAATISKRGTVARKAVGIVGLRTHDNRAHCFTEMLKAGYSVTQIQKGVSLHSNATTLTRHYARIKAVDLHRGPAGQPLAMAA